MLGDLPLSERERFYEFLVANKVEFVADQAGEAFVATIRVVPPEPSTARITGRARQATKQTMRRANSAGPRPKSRAGTAGGAGSTPVQDAAATLKAAQSVLRRRYTRFCNLLPTLMNPPKALRKTALLRFADEVYDARYEKDAQYITLEAKNRLADGAGESLQKLPQTFPDFLYEFAAKRYGLKALVSNNCWGMVSSVELLRGQHVGIDLFGKFIEEYYDTTDLLFFLFTRSAIERVMARSSKKVEQDGDGEKKEDADSKTKPKARVTSSQGKVLSGEMVLTDRQVVEVLKMAIDSKRQELREQVTKKLDVAMQARQEGPGRRPTIETDRVLAICTEEYHNSRDFTGDEIEGETGPNGKLALNADGTAITGAARERDLAPDIRKEVRQVTQRLIASLSSNGEVDVNPQQVYEWALQVTLRRHKLGDFLEEPLGNTTSMDLSEMQEAALNLVETEGRGAPVPFVPSHEVLNLSPEEFEENLEGNVRHLLLNSVSELIGDAVATLSGKAWTDEQAAASMKSALISEFAPAADILMEAIVSKDYSRWKDTLRIEGSGSVMHRQQFEKLHDEFQQVLNTEITAGAVQQICRGVVGADELHDMVRGRANELSKVGRQKKLGDSSSEEEGDLNGTAAFGFTSPSLGKDFADAF